MRGSQEQAAQKKEKSEMTDFLTRINTSPDLFTAIMAAPSGEGVSVSYKRR